MKKKLFCLMSMIIIFILLLSSITVDASTIVIKEDNNPTGVTVLNYENDIYFIRVDDEKMHGYFICKVDDNEQIIGSCSIIIINNMNDAHYLCTYDSNYQNYGCLVISVNNDNEYRILDVTGDLSEAFAIGMEINIIE